MYTAHARAQDTAQLIADRLLGWACSTLQQQPAAFSTILACDTVVRPSHAYTYSWSSFSRERKWASRVKIKKSYRGQREHVHEIIHTHGIR